MTDNLTLVINTSHAAKVVPIVINGVINDSVNIMGKSRVYLPENSVVQPNYLVLNETYLKVHLPAVVLEVVEDNSK